jgi:cell wall-associated NlpC family hydrolase
MWKTLTICLPTAILFSCVDVPQDQPADSPPDTLTATSNNVITDSTISAPDTAQNTINTHHVNPVKLLEFSKTLKGIPYKYGSTDPKKGFDCSGFITYVFNHFDITVPRSSVQFTDEGTPVSLAESKPGDLILFTGIDSTIRKVGHMGIITHSGDSIVFIHSTSGKAHGVTETTLNDYYMGRFMKVIRVFE